MNITLDYTTGIYPGAGIARYTRSLVSALARLDTENTYSLFYAARGLPHPTPETKQASELFAKHPNFRPRNHTSLRSPDVRNLAAPAPPHTCGPFHRQVRCHALTRLRIPTPRDRR